MRLTAFVVVAVFFGLLIPQAQAAVPAHGRSWELLTIHPPSSSRILGLRPIKADGERLIYGVIGPPPGSASGALLGYGATDRGPSGWVNSPIGMPYKTESTETFLLFAPILPIAFSEDEQTKLWFATVPLTPGAPPEETLALYRQIGDGGPEFISPVGSGITLFGYAGFADIANDGSRVVFTSEKHLLPGDATRTAGESVYTWNGSSVELVNVDNGGSLLGTCGAQVSKENGMAPDASRVFFTTVSGSCGGLQEVYLRNLATHNTVEISASECTRVDCNAPADVTFSGATDDGKFAYLTTTQQLVNADEDSTRDLYRYSVVTGKLTLVSGAPSAVTGEVRQAPVFPSEDDTHVYFRANGEIIPGESGSGEKLFRADGSGLHRVAEGSFPGEIQMSTNGEQALFVTPTGISGADTDGQNDAYLYDAEAGTVTWISTGPSGGNGAFTASIEAPSPLNRQELESGDLRPYFAIDGAGDRAFFTTEESLVPEDTNGVFDVYEWAQGEVGLVSPGNQPLKSDFAGVSRDGRTALFATNASLFSYDEDGEGRDIYAARLGGGFPEIHPPECNAVTCPLPAGSRITRPTPASLLPAQRKRGRLRVVEVASKAKKGAIAVVVSAPAPGSVSGQVWAREGGKKVVLAEGSARAKHAGKVELALQLTASARRSTGGGPKHAHLTVSEGSSKVSQAVTVSLR
jgi:hypothetical protein